VFSTDCPHRLALAVALVENQHMRRLLLATTLLSLACGSSEVDKPLAGDDLTCNVVSTTAVPWTDSTPLGIPQEVFSPFAGACQAPFTWDASEWPEVTVVPVKGTSTITVTVALDQGSARRVARTPAGCGDLLEVDGAVTLELPEGTVASQQSVTLTKSTGAGLIMWTLALKEESFGSWISIHNPDPVKTVGSGVSSEGATSGRRWPKQPRPSSSSG
jgi:hypothetical protein